MIKQRLPFPRDVVADDLRTRIAAGEYAPGVQLPTQREIAQNYQVAERTALEALRVLARDGLVVIRPRQGTIVAWPQKTISGPAEQVRRSAAGGLFRPTETVEMLRVKLVGEDVPPDALAAFDLPETAELGLREYLVRSGGKVVTYGASYIHPEVWALVAELRQPVQIPDGIIGAIGRVLGRRTAAAPEHHKASRATPEEALWLGVEPDAPVLLEIVHSVAGDGTLVEWNMSVHPEDYWVGQ